MSRVCNTATLKKPLTESIANSGFLWQVLCAAKDKPVVAIDGHHSDCFFLRLRLSRHDSQLAFLESATRDRANAFALDLYTHQIFAGVTRREVERGCVGPFGEIGRYAEHGDGVALPLHDNQTAVELIDPVLTGR